MVGWQAGHDRRVVRGQGVRSIGRSGDKQVGRQVDRDKGTVGRQGARSVGGI